MLISKMQPVQEAYFGKTPNLVKCEKIIENLAKKYKWNVYKTWNIFEDTASLDTTVASWTRSEFDALEKALQKEFGFRSCKIVYQPIFFINEGDGSIGGSLGGNACRIGCKTLIGRLFLDNDLEYHLPVEQGEGKYYDKYHTSDCVILLVGSILSAGLTAEELLAIILHEIGHGFACTPMTIAGEFIEFIGAVSALTNPTALLQDRNFMRSLGPFIAKLLADYVEDFREQNKNMTEDEKNIQKLIWHLAKVYSLITETKRLLDHMSYRISRTIPFAQNFKRFLTNTFSFLNPFSHIEVSTTYSSEVFSDSFATAYGYGPALTSAFTKFNKFRENANFLLDKDVNILRPIFEFIDFSWTFMDIYTSDHPTDLTRMVNTMDKLERELKSNKLPAPLRKKCLADLKRTRQIYEDYLKDEKGERRFSTKFMFDVLNAKVFGGRLEIRNYFNKLFNFGYDEA